MKWFLTLLLACFRFTLPAQDYTLEGNKVKITQAVLFEKGTAELKLESAAALEIIQQYLADKTYISLLRVECHTGNSGDA
jgi:outer membrane protein OmpA-like peptidoglycan-associated protein